MPASLPPDNPISSSEDDVLNWESTATTFVRHALELDSTHGLVVGVFGSWGSGKTSFINLARPEFEKAKVPVLDFNPWLFSGTNELVHRFFVELSAKMRKMEKTSGLKKIGSYFRKYGDVLSPGIMGISTLAGSPHVGMTFAGILVLLLKKAKTPASAIAVRNKLTQALKKHGKPIIVVLDDVDRLPNNEILELFKLVRLTAGFPNLVYIVACDRVYVEAAFKEVMPDMPAAQGSYLEKIFQWSINIPVAPHEQLRRELRGGIEKALGSISPPFAQSDWPDIEAEIIRPLVRNIRDVRRYSMAVRGAVDSFDKMVALVDVLALEAIRLFMPGVFDKLSHLVEDLCALPDWEANQRRAEDIVLEQMGDSETLKEATRMRLKGLVEDANSEHQSIVRALIHRLFAGGRDQHEEEDPEWSSRQLRNNRVVHSSIFRLYLTRVADSDLTAANHAKDAFDCLHDRKALFESMRLHKHDTGTWPKIILSLWGMFRNEFVREHAESGLIVFWNMLSDMPESNSVSVDEPLQSIQIISESLLETLVRTDDIFDLIKNVFQQLQSLSSGVALIKQIERLNKRKSSFLSDTDFSTLKRLLNNRIRSVHADDLIKERHPAQVLLFSMQCSDSPEAPYINHDSPKLTFLLLWDCRTEGSTGELGSRSVETRQSIHLDTLISIHGSEDMLKIRIESLDQNFHSIEPWIISELGIQSSEARSLLQLAKDKLFYLGHPQKLTIP